MLGSEKSLVLGSGTTLAFLSAGGKFCSMHRLSAYVSDSTIYGRTILSRYGVMLSGPIDFFVFKFCYEFTNFVYCNRWNTESAGILKFALAEFFQSR